MENRTSTSIFLDDSGIFVDTLNYIRINTTNFYTAIVYISKKCSDKQEHHIFQINSDSIEDLGDYSHNETISYLMDLDKSVDLQGIYSITSFPSTHGKK